MKKILLENTERVGEIELLELTEEQFRLLELLEEEFWLGDYISYTVLREEEPFRKV